MSVVGVRDFENVLAEQLRLRVAEHPAKAVVHEIQCAVQPGLGESDAGVGEDGTETLLTLAQRRFGAPALGEIHDRSHDPVALTGLYGVQDDLDRKPAAVLMSSPQFPRG